MSENGTVTVDGPWSLKTSEYDEEMPQSQITYRPNLANMRKRYRNTDKQRHTHKKQEHKY